MHLLGVRENDGWLESAWEFTYRVGWAHIQTAVYEVYDAFEKPEVLVRGEHVDIDNKEEIKELEEELNMSIRGYCPLIKNRLMIIFHNQVKTVTVVMPSLDKISSSQTALSFSSKEKSKGHDAACAGASQTNILHLSSK